jgi:hypothetical protein
MDNKPDFNREELFKKAVQCKTTEELIDAAKQYGIPLDNTQAETILKQINHKNTEITDDELDMVAGGGCGGDPFGRTVDSRCVYCKSKNTQFLHGNDNHLSWYLCNDCKQSFILYGYI